MLSDFITLDSLSNFTIQLIIIVTSTEFTKKIIDKIKINHKKGWKVETEYIVFFYALILSILSCYRDYKLNNPVQSILISGALVLINSLVISYIASASYDKIIKSYIDKNPELEKDT